MCNPPQSMSETARVADKKMPLDVYIHDYLVKRGYKATAEAFKEEGKVSSYPVDFDVPDGYLLEWWSVFYEMFIARAAER